MEDIKLTEDQICKIESIISERDAMADAERVHLHAQVSLSRSLREREIAWWKEILGDKFGTGSHRYDPLKKTIRCGD